MRTVLCLSAAPVVKIIALIHAFGIFVSGLYLQSGQPYIVNVPCSIDVLIRGHRLSHCCWAFVHPVFLSVPRICIGLSSTSPNGFKFYLSQCILGLEPLIIPTLYLGALWGLMRICGFIFKAVFCICLLPPL